MATAPDHMTSLHVGMRDEPGDNRTIDDPQPSIRGLQDALRAVGTLAANEHPVIGAYDKLTTAAVRRFQWYLGNIPGYFRADIGYGTRALLDVPIDGTTGAALFRELANFVRLQWRATGDLVQINFGGLNRTSANSGFSALINGDRDIGVCDRAFAPVLTGMNGEATTQNVYIFVNQLFRVEGAGVSGAVVAPASFSAHKVGRAVDLQLGSAPGAPKLSAEIKQAKADTPFGKFRDNTKLAGSRYGGDFKTSDPPHFDRQILPAGSQVWKSYFFFNQLQYNQSRTLVTAIPAYVAAT